MCKKAHHALAGLDFSASGDRSEPCVRIQRCLEMSPSWADGKIPNKHLYRLVRRHINPLHVRIPWHSGQITTETAKSETGRHARGAKKKKRKKDEKTAQRKAERAATEVPPAEEQGSPPR